MREVGCKPKYLKVLAFALLMPLLAGAGRIHTPQVDLSRDLAADAQLARTQRLPILLVFTTEYCDYCEMLEEDFLQPMLISGHYQDKVLIRKVVASADQSLIDFDGARVDTDTLARRYRVRVYPTLLFLDSTGRELAERLVGINTPEFYGGYLDDNIDVALSRVRQ